MPLRDHNATPCRNCGAPILWRRTNSESLIPLDAEPVPAGNIAIDSVRALVYGPADAEEARERGVPLHQHHRLSCPHADQWARGGSHG